MKQVKPEVDSYLLVDDDCIFGRLGFSFTSENVLSLSKSIYNYCIANNIGSISIGYDGSSWAKSFLTDVLVDYLSTLDIYCVYTEVPCSLFQLSWLTKQNTEDLKHKVLGLYVTSDWYYPEVLSIHFRSHLGEPLTSEEVSSILKTSNEVSIFEVSDVIDPTLPEEVDIGLYPNYLKDKKLLNTNLSTPLHVDCMFGSAEFVMKDLEKLLPQVKLNLYNPYSNPWRLKNYTPSPTGKNLQWCTADIKTGHFLAAINNCGSSVGIWDLTQSVEISPSGVYLLLLYTYSKVYKKRGTVLIPKMLSDRVPLLANTLGFKVELIDSGVDAFITALNSKRKSPALIYGDELGRFWFKGDVKDSNPLLVINHLATCCEFSKKSPGRLLDIISSKYFTREYQYAMLLLPQGSLPKKELESLLIKEYTTGDTLLHSEIGHTSTLRVKGDIKIVITEKLKQRSVVVFIESTDTVKVLNTSKVINKMFTGDVCNDKSNSSVDGTAASTTLLTT